MTSVPGIMGAVGPCQMRLPGRCAMSPSGGTPRPLARDGRLADDAPILLPGVPGSPLGLPERPRHPWHMRLFERFVVTVVLRY